MRIGLMMAFPAGRAARGIILGLIGLGSVLVGGLVASASFSHTDPGSSGSHSPGSHALNPGHIWVSIGAPIGNRITSGGRYHNTSCGGTYCGPYGGDYALDIAYAGTDTPAYLYLDYAGYGTGSSVQPDPNKPISVEVYFSGVSGSGACQYQRLSVYADYFELGSGNHREDLIGYIWLAHMDTWQYANKSVAPSSSRPNPYGSGTIYYFNGLYIGRIYDGSGSCSTGSHVHLEWFSRHAWGAPYEWHGLGPDWYYSGHPVHWASDYGDTYGEDGVNRGAKVGFIGGGTTSAAMWDNPNYSDH